jgi:hypothetical protein
VVQDVLIDGGDFLTILRRVFTRQLTLVETDPELRAFAELRLFKTELTPELAEGHRQQVLAGQQLIVNIAATIRMGIEQHVVRDDLDPFDIARSFLALQNGLIQLWLLSPAAFSLSASASSIAEIFIQGIKKV